MYRFGQSDRLGIYLPNLLASAHPEIDRHEGGDITAETINA
jgi:hypothetical protein